MTSPHIDEFYESIQAPQYHDFTANQDCQSEGDSWFKNNPSQSPLPDFEELNKRTLSKDQLPSSSPEKSQPKENNTVKEVPLPPHNPCIEVLTRSPTDVDDGPLLRSSKLRKRQKSLQRKIRSQTRTRVSKLRVVQKPLENANDSVIPVQKTSFRSKVSIGVPMKKASLSISAKHKKSHPVEEKPTSLATTKEQKENDSQPKSLVQSSAKSCTKSHIVTNKSSEPSKPTVRESLVPSKKTQEPMKEQFVFRALPLDRRIFESCGDLGVPRLGKLPLTQPVSPKLGTRLRVRQQKKQEPTQAALPRSSLSSQNVSARESFNMLSRQAEEERQKKRKISLANPQPFHFQTKDRASIRSSISSSHENSSNSVLRSGTGQKRSIQFALNNSRPAKRTHKESTHSSENEDNHQASTKLSTISSQKKIKQNPLAPHKPLNTLKSNTANVN